jgi:methylthioribulose-1-phosphate dehydratase
MGTSGNLSILISEPCHSRLDRESTNESQVLDSHLHGNDNQKFEFLITASGKDKGELTEDDFLLVDENGKSVQATDLKPSAETLLHSAIYKLTEAKAIYHVHTTNGTLLSMSNTEQSFIQFSNLEMLKGLGFKTHDVTVNIPIIENSQDMEYIASIAHDYIDESMPGLILRGHGIYGWGKTPEEAKRHIEIFEFLFEYRVKELSI